jgi:hypothetical protein
MQHSEIRQTSLRRTLTLPLTPILVWAAFGLGLIVAYMALGTGRVPLDMLYNSDALYLPALYRDLTGGLGLRGWSLTPAPYFFPDMLLFFNLNRVLGSFRLAIFAYGLIQVLIFVAGLITLTRLMVGRNPHIQSLVPLTGTLFFLYFYARPFLFFSMILANAFHFSVIVMGIGCLALVSATMTRPRIDRTVIAPAMAALLCSTLMVASDMLYAIQVLAPMILSLWLLAPLKQIMYHRALFYSLLGLAVPIGLPISDALNRVLTGENTRFGPTKFSFEKLQTAQHQLLDWIQQVWLQHTLLPIAVVSFVLASGLVFVRILRERKQTEQSATRLLIVAFLVFQTAVVIPSMLYNGTFTERYLEPLIFMPTFFGWPLLAAAAHKPASILNNPWGSWIAAGAAILGCLVILARIEIPQQLGQIVNYYPDLVRCMDEQTQQRNLHSGLSNYWQAKYVSMLSHNDLQVVQLTTSLEPWYWINNRHWYEKPFDFVLINRVEVLDFRLDRVKLIDRFGPPDDSFSCGDNEVLIYRSAQFREQFLAAAPGQK